MSLNVVSGAGNVGRKNNRARFAFALNPAALVLTTLLYRGYSSQIVPGVGPPPAPVPVTVPAPHGGMAAQICAAAERLCRRAVPESGTWDGRRWTATRGRLVGRNFHVACEDAATGDTLAFLLLDAASGEPVQVGLYLPPGRAGRPRGPGPVTETTARGRARDALRAIYGDESLAAPWRIAAGSVHFVSSGFRRVRVYRERGRNREQGWIDLDDHTGRLLHFLRRAANPGETEGKEKRSSTP